MKILLINGGKAFAHSGGELNNTLHAVAVDTLKELGHEVRETVIEQGYEVATEVQNFLWADSIVYQMPGWWMGAPWTVKRYIDDVFTEGHGSLYASDGRTRQDPTKQYGSGGTDRAHCAAVGDAFARARRSCEAVRRRFTPTGTQRHLLQ